MKPARSLYAVALLSALVVTDAMAADCQIADAKLEEAILNNPAFEGQQTDKPYAICAA
jgi:uncharacterized protein